MYFNSPFMGPLPGHLPPIPQPQTSVVPVRNSASINQVTVLKSLDHPVNKRFYLNDEKQVQKENFQNAYLYNATQVPVCGIESLANLIQSCSLNRQNILIRGMPVGATERVRKVKESFVEHSEGTPWVMLDFDNIPVPESLDPLSVAAIEWVVQKLPSEFQNVGYYYQHSGSAGILRSDGTPMKDGLNVHLFFWLNRPITGKALTAYLSLHCLETGFYELGENRGDVVELRYGIDPAPIRSEVQAHYVASPTIGEGVICSLTEGTRQDLIEKANDSVQVPRLAEDLDKQVQMLKNKLVTDYKRRHGFETRILQTAAQDGKVAINRYSVPARHASQTVRGGRAFADAKLSEDERYLTLFFEDEGSPGSWFVCKDRPQLGVRHGDSATMPLKELSQGAHEYVRDQLKWFFEVPHQHLELVDGYLPPLAQFAKAKVSLVLSPTGSGKTTAAVTWISQQIASRKLVFYAAPTIALVKQMQASLQKAGLAPRYYENVGFMELQYQGVIVTTNESLPKLLERAYGTYMQHALILDEIHQGLDGFMRTNKRQQELEGALSKACQSLLLTGTLTDTQRLALTEVAKHALGNLRAESYCCYEFTPFKRNQLNVLPSSRFDSDLAHLLADFQEKLRNGESLPRFVMLLDTSRMEAFRILLNTYHLAEHALIVSRPENTPAEIEEARTSDKPILISSPLFGLGLNFSHEPAKLWCRFDSVNADTSQIIQAVNRANRGRGQAEVRIYGNIDSGADFRLPDQLRLKNEIANRYLGEASLTGLLEDHFQLDRVTYQSLREVERDSGIALSVLVRNDAIQNFTVVDVAALPEVSREKQKIVKEARKAARTFYAQDIRAYYSRHIWRGVEDGLFELTSLYQERKENWKNLTPRLERDFENEELAIIMAMCGIADTAAAKKVKATKILRLCGRVLPWNSGQYDRKVFADWAKVAAEKTQNYVLLLEKLRDLKEGRITAVDLSASLTRNARLGEAFQALTSSDLEFQAIGKKIENLKRLRQQVRRKGGEKARRAVAQKGLLLLQELLQSFGISYGQKVTNGRKVTDLTNPIVPTRWDLDWTIIILKRQVARFKALPVGQKEPVMPPPEEDELDHNLAPYTPMHRQICAACCFFDDNACVLGNAMDWQSGGEPPEGLKCPQFKAMPVELLLE